MKKSLGMVGALVVAATLNTTLPAKSESLAPKKTVTHFGQKLNKVQDIHYGEVKFEDKFDTLPEEQALKLAYENRSNFLKNRIWKYLPGTTTANEFFVKPLYEIGQVFTFTDLTPKSLNSPLNQMETTDRAWSEYGSEDNMDLMMFKYFLTHHITREEAFASIESFTRDAIAQNKTQFLPNVLLHLKDLNSPYIPLPEQKMFYDDVKKYITLHKDVANKEIALGDKVERSAKADWKLQHDVHVRKLIYQGMVSLWDKLDIALQNADKVLKTNAFTYTDPFAISKPAKVAVRPAAPMTKPQPAVGPQTDRTTEISKDDAIERHEDVEKILELNIKEAAHALKLSARHVIPVINDVEGAMPKRNALLRYILRSTYQSKDHPTVSMFGPEVSWETRTLYDLKDAPTNLKMNVVTQEELFCKNHIKLISLQLEKYPEHALMANEVLEDRKSCVSSLPESSAYKILRKNRRAWVKRLEKVENISKALQKEIAENTPMTPNPAPTATATPTPTVSVLPTE